MVFLTTPGATGMLQLFVVITSLFGIVSCDGPLKIFAKGYNRKNLPKDGGWTQWFNTYFGHGAGDHERLYDVWRMYGRGCDGLPCRRPLAMKIISTNWLAPHEEGNDISGHPRRGMDCFNHHQYRGKKCVDYMVRYFCPEMGVTCRKRRKEEKQRDLEKEKSMKTWNSVNKDHYPELPGSISNKDVLSKYNWKVKPGG